jgi:hypothetical protein
MIRESRFCNKVAKEVKERDMEDKEPAMGRRTMTRQQAKMSAQ